MSRRRAALSPSLFPFLAVLICTLGTLILLLALVAQEAKEAAVAHAEQTKQDAIRERLAANPNEKPAAAPEKLPLPGNDSGITLDDANRMVEEGQFRVEQLVSYRDVQTQDAETKRNEVAQLEAAIRDLKDRLQNLKTEVEMATSELDPTEVLKVDDATLMMMQEEMEKLRADIKELQSSERGQKPRVVIVPHRGPNGTQRRPVYVECTEDEIRIMPEGARITKTQALAAAESKNPNANPLGSALRVARRHAMQAYGDQVAPYPLLIVRPGGIRMFHLASALMKDWDDQYGYELVPGEVDLAFPGGDNVLQKDLEYAIHEASSRNFMFARGSGGGGRGNGSGGGGDGLYDGISSNDRGDYASGANADVGSDSNSAGSNSSGGGSPYAAQSSAAQSGEPGGLPQPKKPLPVLSAKSLDQQGLKNGFTPARDQRFANAFGTQPPLGSNGQSFGANGEISSDSEALNDFLQGRSPTDFPSGPDDSQSRPNAQASSGSQSPGQAQGTADSQDEFSDSGSSKEGDVSASNGRVVGGSQSSPGGNQSMPMPQSSNGQANSASTSMQAGTAQPSSSQPSSSQPSSSQPGSPQENESPNADQPADPSVTMSSSQSDNPVRRQGRDWAMPEAFRGMGGTEVVRPISMICHHDRYELIERGRVVATYSFQRGDVYQSTIELATAVRDRVATWGTTLPGGRWQPRLDVQVGPHAEQRFHELQTLMQGSGVEINRRSP